MEQKKLVLVLDLDNTLLHSEVFEVGRTYHQRGDRPDSRPKMVVCEQTCPLMSAIRKRKMIEQGGIHILDESKSLYHIWEPRLFSHRVKLRPFCGIFLKAAMENFEVHFNTAATRKYGIRILQVLKAELLSLVSQAHGDDEEKSTLWRNMVQLTFNEKRLITRDDKEKYSVRSSLQENAETRRNAENILLSRGLPITPESVKREIDKLNFTRKSLDALAGGDDSFFVILDDRDDVWPTKVKLFDSGVP